MEFEMRYKAFEIQLAIVCTKVERVSTAFGTVGKESVARRGVSDSTDKVFVDAHVAPCQGEKKSELEQVVAEHGAEKKGTLLVDGLQVPMIAGKSDALEDGVVVVVSPAVDIYSAAEIEGTPAYTVAVVAAAVDNKLNCGP
jgi:hypothetical protein